MKILTTKGLLDDFELQVKDVIEWGDNHRKTATEWYYQGELVRRDVNVNLLRPIDLGAEQGRIG